MTDIFPTETTGLPNASPSETVELSDGDTLRAADRPGRASGSATTPCACSAYNGSIPGPTLRVREGSEILVDVHQRRRPGGDRPLAWTAARQPLRRHARDAAADPGRRGLLLPDAVPRPGPLLVPPAHPRGLRPGDGPLRQHRRRTRATPTTGRRSHRELVLTLDDVLIEDGRIAAFSRTETTYAAMGRFGNVMLVGGEPHLALDAQAGRSFASTSRTPRTRACSTSPFRARG